MKFKLGHNNKLEMLKRVYVDCIDTQFYIGAVQCTTGFHLDEKITYIVSFIACLGLSLTVMMKPQNQCFFVYQEDRQNS